MSEPPASRRAIAGDLREAIAKGVYPPGAKLPSRSELMKTYGVASHTVTTAIDALRAEGLVVGRTGSGWYVRTPPPVMRLARARLSRSERLAGRGTFTTDAHGGGWIPRVEVSIHITAASADVAIALEVEPGAEILVRERVMFADDVPLQLATSSLPRSLTATTAIEQENTGPGGIYARLEEQGHPLHHFTELVRVGPASAGEAARLQIPPGAAVYRIQRVAHTADRPVEVNMITAVGDRYELYYELPAD